MTTGAETRARGQRIWYASNPPSLTRDSGRRSPFARPTMRRASTRNPSGRPRPARSVRAQLRSDHAAVLEDDAGPAVATTRDPRGPGNEQTVIASPSYAAE